jgi:hypothetical protein
MNLNDFLKTVTRSENHDDAVIYSHDGDFLLVMFEDKPNFGDRIDEVLTVMRAIDDEDCVVGFKIKGFRRLISEFKQLGVEFKRKAFIKVFLKQLDWKQDQAAWKTYHLLVDRSDDLTVDTDMVAGCAG